MNERATGAAAVILVLARHRVAPYLFMLVAFLLCAWSLTKLNTRFFPEFEIRLISVHVSWSGASAEDVRDSVVTPLENEFSGLANLKNMDAYASDGFAGIYLEYPESADMTRALEDVKNAVDLVARKLPADAETPETRLIENRDQIARLIVAGDTLGDVRAVTRRLEKELARAGIARVKVSGLPDEEIQVFFSQRRLAELGFSLREAARRVAGENLDVSAGEVGGAAGAERQIRALSRREDVRTLADVPLHVGGAGEVLRLGDAANGLQRVVKDGAPRFFYQGRPAAELQLERREEKGTLQSADLLLPWLAAARAELPPDITLALHDQSFRAIESRLDLLVKNGAYGFLLVLIILFLFLNGRVAFWVGVSVPTVFCITLFVFYLLGGDINMISMFALIMATGIVVDDSIVVGENAYYRLQQGEEPLAAAVNGATQMFAPVFASTLTTIASFLPLFIVGGIIGAIIFDIPFVIVCILIAAVSECFLILPGHLYAAFRASRLSQPSAIRRVLEGAFTAFQEKGFRPLASLAVRFRLVTVAACAALLIVSVGLMAGGVVKYRFFPGAELNIFNVQAEFVAGTPSREVDRFAGHLLETLRETEASYPEEKNLLRHALVRMGVGGERSRTDSKGKMSIRVELSYPDERRVRVADFIKNWRARVQLPAGMSSFSMEERRGGPPGKDLAVEITGDNMQQIKTASETLRRRLETMPELSLVRDDLPYGKEQLVFSLTPLGRELGLSVGEVAAQIRDAYDGYVAQTFYEGADEVDLRFMYDDSARRGVSSLAGFQVRLANGALAPLGDVATWRSRRGFDLIRRKDGKPIVEVTADVDFKQTDLGALLQRLSSGPLRDLREQFGVSTAFGGKQTDERETVRDMLIGLGMAVALIYVVLTGVFASWSLPVIIMLTMPLGAIGTIAGHWIMEKDMSILSFFGVFTLMGIIINNSIVLVRYYQELREQNPDGDVTAQIIDAACRRFRAVLVTSLTTIVGLTPLMLETSQQAQFLIPMAISICFGLAFATVLVLLFTPACLSFHQSCLAALDKFRAFLRGAPAPKERAEG